MKTTLESKNYWLLSHVPNYHYDVCIQFCLQAHWWTVVMTYAVLVSLFSVSIHKCCHVMYTNMICRRVVPWMRLHWYRFTFNILQNLSNGLSPVRLQAITVTHNDTSKWTNLVKYLNQMTNLSFLPRKCISKCCLQNVLFTHKGPGDTIWPHRSLSTLVQVMAWCVMAPGHYSTNVDLSARRICDIHLGEILPDVLKNSIHTVI